MDKLSDVGTNFFFHLHSHFKQATAASPTKQILLVTGISLVTGVGLNLLLNKLISQLTAKKKEELTAGASSLKMQKVTTVMLEHEGT